MLISSPSDEAEIPPIGGLRQKGTGKKGPDHENRQEVSIDNRIQGFNGKNRYMNTIMLLLIFRTSDL